MTSLISFLQVALFLVAVAASPTGIHECSVELPIGNGQSVRPAEEIIDQRDFPKPGEIDFNQPDIPIWKSMQEIIADINKKITELFLKNPLTKGDQH